MTARGLRLRNGRRCAVSVRFGSTPVMACRYVECAWQVPKLIDELASRMHMYPAVQTYLDLDHEAPDFTALGCVVLVKAGSIGLVSQFNFSSSVYVPVERGVNINLEGLESSPLIIKRKFPKHFWPTFKWGRKGYMQTRWKMNNM
ncbi:hypothetical protein NECAME_14548 [Necator americanus]|uniref:Uncharacterized protein n=1 Tax=Necator americanus TaxID=51031 RepID=W2SMB7_NECAM|nr:hypothetical protein NECAME_14548 [Necator americanus]ETN70760.1 hypothetical protein NECAME_14548 [Necator americanus]